MASNGAASAFVLPAPLISQGFGLRPETGDDLPFLQALYASTRAEELAPVAWSDEQKWLFLEQQFRAQRHHYKTYLADSRFDVLECAGAPVGRLYLSDKQTQVYIVDIALLPAWRGKGVGSAILEALKSACGARGLGVGIMVEKFNPALQLYRRLDFSEVADHGVYLEMEWVPATPAVN